jgi:hypothetical protein
VTRKEDAGRVSRHKWLAAVDRSALRALRMTHLHIFSRLPEVLERATRVTRHTSADAEKRRVADLRRK